MQSMQRASRASAATSYTRRRRPLPQCERPLRVLRRRARLAAFIRRGAAADVLAACPAVSRDERPETVARHRQCGAAAIAAGLASSGRAGAPAAACVARHRAAPKRVRRKVRYLACWCGAPVAAKALADAREACLAVRGDDDEEALPALVDLSLSSPKPPSKPVIVKNDDACRDYDAPD